MKIALALLSVLVVGSVAAGAAPEDFFVSPAGRDANAGSRSAPFATVLRARDAVRVALARPGGLPDGATVWIAGGDYELHETLELTAADSGHAGAPIIYRATGNSVPRLLGSAAVNPAAWKPLGDAARQRVHPRVDPAVLRELDLAGLGLTRTRQFAPGSRFTDQWFTIDLFANGQRQPLSHWPNPTENIRGSNDPGWTTCNGSKSADAFCYGAGGEPDDKDATDELDLDGTHRAERWKASLAAGHEIWLKGFWRTPWEPITMKVAGIDPATESIRLAEAPPEGMGSKYTHAAETNPPWRVGSGQEKWLALNLLDEIDQPGEWALDVADQKLYWYPPAPVSTLEVRISDRGTPLVRLDGAAFVQLIGLTLEGGMGTGVEIVNGQDDTVAGCTIRNVDGTGIRLQGGARNTVQSCDIVEGGGCGIEVLHVGDRAKLISADTRLLNNHIHHTGRLAFREGIRLDTVVGVTVAHNLLHDLPKGGVRTDGINNCLFEANEIHNNALGESDTGAFYNYGGWTTYGNVFRGNLVHHCNRSNGFYSDDGTSGDIYEENVVYDVINGLLFGGGHDLIARHNLFVKTKAQSLDDRGIARHYELGTAYEARLRAMRPDEEPWKSYGERLKTEFALRENLWADVLDPAKHPEYPNGSAMVDNVAVATGGFLRPKHGDVDVRDNLLISTAAQAGFRDLARMDLHTDKPEILAKFPRLDTILAQAGLQRDEYRLQVPTREETGGFTDHGREGDLRNEDQFIKRAQ